MDIRNNLDELKKHIPENVKLVAVSKTKPASDIEEAYNAGQRIFGENKAQELSAKAEVLPKDIEWHFIGHLQTNKVKYIAPVVSLVHAVDSLKLLKEINKQAANNNRVIDCLLQFHIAEEATKFGLSRNEADELLQSDGFAKLNNIRIIGVMGMATYTSDKEQIKREFDNLVKYKNSIKEQYFIGKDYFKEVSMGMSGDYKIAIQEGSTMVRVGSLIFGERNY